MVRIPTCHAVACVMDCPEAYGHHYSSSRGSSQPWRYQACIAGCDVKIPEHQGHVLPLKSSVHIFASLIAYVRLHAGCGAQVRAEEASQAHITYVDMRCCPSQGSSHPDSCMVRCSLEMPVYKSMNNPASRAFCSTVMGIIVKQTLSLVMVAALPVDSRELQQRVLSSLLCCAVALVESMCRNKQHDWACA